MEEKQSKYESVAADISRLIESGTFRPGDRIPSVRSSSSQRQVSISTILQAYYLLEARGLIESRPQSGFYVRALLPDACPEPEISSPKHDPINVSVREMTMMVLRDTLNPNLIQFGAALPNKDLQATVKLGKIIGSICRENSDLVGQCFIAPGYEPLRIQIAQRAVAAGCGISPDEIITTSGCVDAMNLCLRAVCRPGNTVAIESPTYFGILQALEAMGLKALEIPTCPRDGISLEALQFALEHNPIHACLLVTNFNNPLGSCMPDGKKRELVKLLEQHNVPLIENDITGEIYFQGGRPSVAKAYDKKGLVMLCSSFSKDISSACRVGWIVAGRFKQEIVWLKYTASLAVQTLMQVAIARFLDSGGYDYHLRKIRREYARKVASMSQAVSRRFPDGTRVTRPAGGFVLWIQLADNVDSLELYHLAIQSGITIAPGRMFSATEQYRNFIRLNAANWSQDSEKAIERLGGLVDFLQK
ncbi:MAG: PLP-dependent aminotransferase family protein [Anaerolineales bacterium]|nr:PLP-dependent aminotransferase family protein [Anaerolineales bacterium]